MFRSLIIGLVVSGSLVSVSFAGGFGGGVRVPTRLPTPTFPSPKPVPVSGSREYIRRMGEAQGFFPSGPPRYPFGKHESVDVKPEEKKAGMILRKFGF